MAAADAVDHRDEPDRQVFEEFDSIGCMIVLEGDQSLGDEAHRFTTTTSSGNPPTPHTSSVQGFWSDLLTAAGS